MEGAVSAEQKRKGDKYPLTVSRTAKEHALTCSKTPVPYTKPGPVQVKSEEETAGDHVTSKPSSSAGGARFYFESDALALKNNPDYRQLLRTLALLEAQKMQAIRDMEVLLQAQKRAEKDPLGFVEALQNRTLEPLPRRQSVVELPDIEWKAYIESLQQVAKQHSAMFLNTRRQHAKPLISSLDEKLVATTTKALSRNPNKSATFGQQWTAEEQARFEELLKIHPPEAVERSRFQKIAKALGSRTTQQVATHVQKYFIKLANAGLPVPGRTPNISRHTKKKGKGKRSLKRPSTFFSTLMPQVMMTGDTSGSATPTSEASNYDSSDEDSYSSELISADSIGGVAEEEGEGSSGSSSPRVPAVVKCLHCAGEVQRGVYWQCSECPQATPTQLCNECINSDYRSQCHSPSHNMQLLSLAPPHTYAGDAEDTPTCFMDKDYTNFEVHNTQTGYNYLDPNFYPAS